MKKSILILLCIITMCVLPVCAHSGDTDSKGGHYDRESGEYHYHHGYPAHSHYGGTCPYMSDETTSGNSEVFSIWQSMGLTAGLVLTPIVLFLIPLVQQKILNMPDISANDKYKTHTFHYVSESKKDISKNHEYLNSLEKHEVDNGCSSALNAIVNENWQYNIELNKLSKQQNDLIKTEKIREQYLSLHTKIFAIGLIILGFFCCKPYANYFFYHDSLIVFLASLFFPLLNYPATIYFFYFIQKNLLDKKFYASNMNIENKKEKLFVAYQSKIKELFGNYTTRQLAEVPDEIYFEDGFPDDAQNTYTRYIAYGEKYHEKHNCSGAFVKMNEFKCQRNGYDNCAKCATWHKEPKWLDLYWRVESIHFKFLGSDDKELVQD